MASPFSFFRKYSGGMMVIMVILSMLLFTLTDLFMDPSANLWLLGILIGGAVFGIAGIGQGRWLQWGIGGAILGAALGYILPGFVQGTGLSSSLGVIDEDDIYDMEVRRSVANQFIVRATEASFGEGTGRFATLFGFGHNSNREDVIFGKLMRAEADRLGITVDKTMVNDYLNRVTSDKLTDKDYIETRNALGYQNGPLDDVTLVDILGDEIKARMAYQMLRPRTTSLPPGPEVYWQYFRRLHVRQQLNLAALDLDDFVDDVGEPSEGEINELFAQYAKKFPNQDEPGSPGFRLPFRARLAYLEVDSKAVATTIGEVSDEDVQKYYDENKETPMIRRPVMPDFDTEKEPAKPEADPADNTETKTEPEVGKTPDEAKPAEPQPEKPTDDAPKEDGDQPKSDTPKVETPKAEPPAETSEKKTDEAADAPPAAEKSGEEKTDAPAADKPADEAESSDGSCSPFAPDEVKTEEAATPPAAEDAKPEAPKPATAEPAAADTEKKSESPAAADEKPTTKETTEEKPTDDTKPTETPSLTIPPMDVPATPAVPAAGPDKDKFPEPQYEYRVLDDELKAEIRDEIVRQRIREAVDAKMDKARAEMETLASQRSRERFSRIEKDPGKFEGRGEAQEKALKKLREDMRTYHDDLNARLKKFAAENGLAYVETPMISYSDLLDEQDYPIGTASEPSDNPMFAAQSASVALTLFQSFSGEEQNDELQLYNVRRAQRQSANLDGGEYHYAYWAIDFSTSHIPTLDEVKDMVVLAWKRLKARDLAIKRGEELAGRIRQGLAKTGEDKQDMAAVLKEDTATGSSDGAAITVQATLPFSWLRTSTASPMDFQRPQASLSPIQFAGGGALDRVGDTFMAAVFDDMQDDEVKVLPNGDLSKYYVVHVTNRFPTPEIGEDGLRDRFANEGKQFAFAQSPMLGVMQRELDSPASLAWERSVWLRYDIDPDGEPEE